MIKLILKRVPKLTAHKYYFEEKIKSSESNSVQNKMWEILIVENEEFYSKVFQGAMCE